MREDDQLSYPNRFRRSYRQQADDGELVGDSYLWFSLYWAARAGGQASEPTRWALGF
jgi:hypothetical protein